MLAVGSGATNVARYLIQNGADPTVENFDGDTLLSRAQGAGRKKAPFYKWLLHNCIYLKRNRSGQGRSRPAEERTGKDRCVSSCYRAATCADKGRGTGNEYLEKQARTCG